MRSDLFTSPKKDNQAQESLSVTRKLTKRVGFDTNPTDGAQESPSQTPQPTTKQSEDLGYLRPADQSPNGINGSQSAAAATEPEQVKGNELAIVHEEEPAPAPVIETSEASADKTPGAYWMLPSKEEIMAMNRMQRQIVADFTVGRENIGSVRFKVPVDLTNIDLDDLYVTIVKLRATVRHRLPQRSKEAASG